MEWTAWSSIQYKVKNQRCRHFSEHLPLAINKKKTNPLYKIISKFKKKILHRELPEFTL